MLNTYFLTVSIKNNIQSDHIGGAWTGTKIQQWRPQGKKTRSLRAHESTLSHVELQHLVAFDRRPPLGDEELRLTEHITVLVRLCFGYGAVTLQGSDSAVLNSSVSVILVKFPFLKYNSCVHLTLFDHVIKTLSIGMAKTK